MTHVISPFYTPTRVALQDVHSHSGEISQMRDLSTAEPFRVVGVVFTGSTIDTNFWTATNSGAGSGNTQTSGLMSTASGTANSGYAQVVSSRLGRFIFAHPLSMRMAGRITAATVALNARRWGVGAPVAGASPPNGFWFEQSAAGVLSVVHSNTSSPTSVASGSFNGEVKTYVLDTNVHAFEIHYFVMEAQFFIDNVLIHTFTPTTANLSAGYTLPIFWSSTNTASGTTSGVFECWAAIIRRMGRDVTQPTYGGQPGVGTKLLKIGAGAIHSLSITAVANNAVITLYDSTTAAGTVIWSSGAMSSQTQPFDIPLHGTPFFTGLTIDITAASATTVVLYE